MKIMITGANGFLGCYLTDLLLKKKLTVIATGKGDSRLKFNSEFFHYVSLDFTDAVSVSKIIQEHQPDVLVHTGAMSKPNECEADKELAYLVNVSGTQHLLDNAAKNRSHFIFLSTDFIFNGKKGMYQEDEKADPVNYYGETKAAAEKLVKKYPYNWTIVRTVTVYGKVLTGRDNILSVVKRKLENKEEYKVVNDQVRTPTYVEDLAAGIFSIIEKKATGIYNLSGTDILTPYEMACLAADFLQLDSKLLKKVTEKDFEEPAKRPLKTGLVIDKAKKDLDYHPLSFMQGLKKTFTD